MLGANLLTGLALGAGGLYFLDQRQGARRRKLIADQCTRLLNEFGRGLDLSWRDLKNRTQGTVAEARSMLLSGDAPDDTLIHRVRSTMGHYVSNAQAIEVGCNLGHVVLRGPVLRAELPVVMAAVAAIPGVKTVSDELVVQDEIAGHSTPRAAACVTNSPGAKLLMGGVGGALLLHCMTARRRSLVDLGLGFVGFGMLTQAITPSSVDPNRVTFHKTVSINAPLEKVFSFLSRPGNWMHITPKLRNLQLREGNAFSKDVVLPGINVHCAERISRLDENACFATESLPDSWLSYTKQIHFERAENGTRVLLTFSYSPPGGPVGHAIGGILGINAKDFFDDFLMRAKTYLETGLQPHDAAKGLQQQPAAAAAS